MHADSIMFRVLLIVLLAVHYWWITLPAIALVGFGAWKLLRRKKPFAVVPAAEWSAEPSYAQKYEQLLLAVATKYPGESRHETALRYIRNAENRCDGPSAAAAPPSENDHAQ